MNFLRRIFTLPFSAGCLTILLSCMILFSLGSRKPAFLDGMDNKVMDVLFNLRGPTAHTGQVIIVDIDEESLDRIGQWPWPRHIMADLTRVIQENGARSIGFDILFAEADRTSPVHQISILTPLIEKRVPPDVKQRILETYNTDYDAVFANALSRSRSVLGYVFQLRDDGLKTGSRLPFPSARIRLSPENARMDSLALVPAYRAIMNIDTVAVAESEGFFNVLTDDSGTVRQVPLLMAMDGIPYPSLALETFRVGTGASDIIIHTDPRIKTAQAPIIGVSIGENFFPTGNTGQLFINHRGPPNTFPYVPAWHLVSTRNHPQLKDKFVLVGSSATGLYDLKATAFSSTMPGIEINATIIDNFIGKDPFLYDRYTEIFITYIMVLVGGGILTLLLSALPALPGALGALLFFVAVMGGNYIFFFLHHRQVGLTYALFTFFVILIVVNILNYLREGRTRKYIQRAFAHYVAPEVVASLLKHPGRLSLNGEQKILTVLFSDIRGFTRLSENMDSQSLGKFMNLYLTRMSRIIMENKGTVDKFIGDAIMAFWGAPGDDPDHAARAVHTALMMNKGLQELNTELKRSGLPEIRIGIGINTGVMSVGNFGSKERFDYTVMGDNVNLASRLEGANKAHGTTILVSEAVARQLSGRFSFRYIDQVRVRGREQPVRIYEPGPLPDSMEAPGPDR